jgi:transposase
MLAHRARRRDFVGLEARRRQAVTWILEGQRKMDVARRLGVTRQAVWLWWRAWRTAGSAALAQRKNPVPREVALRNLAKARASPRWHPPRPWRSAEETRVIKRLVWQWFNYRGPGKWSARALARWLGVTHTYVNMLAREFAPRLALGAVTRSTSLRVTVSEAESVSVSRTAADPGRPPRSGAYGGADFEQLRRAQQRTERMRARGELRQPRFWKVVEVAVGDNVEKFVVRNQPKKFAEEFLPLPAGQAWASLPPAGPPRRRRGVSRPTFWRWR